MPGSGKEAKKQQKGAGGGDSGSILCRRSIRPCRTLRVSSLASRKIDNGTAGEAAEEGAGASFVDGPLVLVGDSKSCRLELAFKQQGVGVRTTTTQGQFWSYLQRSRIAISLVQKLQHLRLRRTYSQLVG